MFLNFGLREIQFSPVMPDEAAWIVLLEQQDRDLAPSISGPLFASLLQPFVTLRGRN